MQKQKKIKDNTPRQTGKTYFNRIKAKDESWTKLRDEALANGTWRPGKK